MRLPAVRNGPRLLLAGLAACSFAAPLVTHAANRLLSGVPAPAGGRAWLFVVPVLLTACAFVRPRSSVQWAAFAAAAAGLLGACWMAGMAAVELARASPPASRTALGVGFWTLALCLGLACVDAAQRLRLRPIPVLLAACVVPASVSALALAGQFRALSLAQEAGSHADAFAGALLRHVLLVIGTVAAALLLGLPLGVTVQRRRRWQSPVFAMLNIVQTVPSVALFGLLIAPLSAAGLSGIGPVPALVALVLYALLPVVRAVVAGLDGVDAAVLEAADGLGFPPRRVLVQVALPLAAPALIAGLRIALVQTVGLAVVAALIGAGGLGDFVFQGLGQYAVDLVLLGALPAIALALAADLLLRLAAAPFQAARA